MQYNGGISAAMNGQNFWKGAGAGAIGGFLMGRRGFFQPKGTMELKMASFMVKQGLVGFNTRVIKKFFEVLMENF